MKIFKGRKRDSQKGMALILAIGLLAVLSILGAVVLDVSTKGLKQTAGDLPRQRAFYAADRAVDYALNDTILAILDGDSGSTTVDLTTTTHKNLILSDDASKGVTLEEGTVKDFGADGETGLPNYIKEIFGISAKGNLFHVNVKTTVHKNTPVEQSVHIDSGVLRVWMSQDDQILITGGKG